MNPDDLITSKNNAEPIAEMECECRRTGCSIDILGDATEYGTYPTYNTNAEGKVYIDNYDTFDIIYLH